MMETDDKKKRLIAFEGPDGCGKTSQSKRLAEYLGAEWRCFPNRNTPIGRMIDWHLKKFWAATYTPTAPAWVPDQPLLDGMAFQALQLANRIECAVDFKNTLSTKSIVCDRYWPSGYAYGGADGLDKPYMIQLHAGLLQPDLFILFDVDAEVAAARMADKAKDRYEQNLDFARAVIANYRELWDLNRDDPKWVRINANGSPEETWEQLLSKIR